MPVRVSKILEELKRAKRPTLRSLYFTQAQFGAPGQKGMMTRGSLSNDPAAKLLWWDNKEKRFSLIENDGQGQKPVLDADTAGLMRTFLRQPINWVTMIDQNSNTGEEKIKRSHSIDDVDPEQPVSPDIIKRADREHRSRMFMLVVVSLIVAGGLAYWYGRNQKRKLVLGGKTLD